jgi:two-component system, chemotaxis family, protein-glutamate methylesterase/glutaminase
MRPRRLLIVDASAVIRQRLTAALAAAPAIDVVGSAASGRSALMKLPLLRPDVVALDADLPGSDSLDTLAAIHLAFPRLPVVLLSNSAAHAAASTVHALSLGAHDYVMKPEAAVPSADAIGQLCGDLLSWIDECCPDPDGSRPVTVTHPNASVAVDARIDVVAIGISTGGPGALMELIPVFAADFPVPILIVQHMPPMFTKLLGERLTSRARITVAEGAAARPVEAGHAWIAPGGFHMGVVRHGRGVELTTNQAPPENSCRPSVDVLFRSVAEVYGRHALAIVMTGMGQDGLRGCQRVHAAGGHVFAQDERSSVVWGMPGVVARAGLADQILPLHALGAAIVERVYRHRHSACVTA